MQRQIPIERCDTCAEIADRALDGNVQVFRDASTEFLKHVVDAHASEVLSLLAEHYGPIFLTKRQLM
ncbi:MAG: hypothetical protein HY296_04400 [Thaumarchaeota archaeon]|nr:hypothetical protein [Nitrososphaerota archaeon]